MRTLKFTILKKFVVTAFSLLTIFSASAEVPAFDSDKPVTTFSPSYSQVFNTWDGTVFYNQWDMLDPNSAFAAADIAPGYLQFVFPAKRLIRSKTSYSAPYVFSVVLEWSVVSNRGGVIVRAKSTGNLEALQEPAISDPGFNREGIAFYPSDDGQNMVAQFSGVDNGFSLTTVTKINAPKPAGVTSLLTDKGIKDFNNFMGKLLPSK